MVDLRAGDQRQTLQEPRRCSFAPASESGVAWAYSRAEIASQHCEFHSETFTVSRETSERFDLARQCMMVNGEPMSAAWQRARTTLDLSGKLGQQAA
jgi:hypothetical protein